MDTFVTSVVIGIGIFLTLKIFSVIFNYIKLCKKLSKLPQPPSHWLKGNMDQLKDSAAYMETVRGMMEKDGVRMYCMWLGPFPSCGVTHPETLKQLVHATSEKATGWGDGYKAIMPWIGDGLLCSYGRKWERNRKLLTPAFHFDILKGYISVMNNGADTLLNNLWEGAKKGDSVEISGPISKATLDVMLRCSLSHDADIQNTKKGDHPYLVAVRNMNKLIWDRLLNPLLFPDTMFNISGTGRAFNKYCDVAHKFTSRIIAKRQKILKADGVDREKRHLDFLDILLTARDDEGAGLSDQEIQDEVDTFTFEGHDTTKSALSWTMHALAKYPDIQQRAYEDVQRVLGDADYIPMEALGKFEYFNCFLKEVLRFYSPVPYISRRSRKPVFLDGIEIPPGPRIDILIMLIHHNPEIWPDHNEFRPERFDRYHRDDKDPYGFVPFSVGSRNCIGQNFAMNEVKIVTAKLLQRFEVSLDPDHKPIPSPDVVLTSKNGIKLKLKKRT